MHVGVIRGDMPGPVLLDGLESVSQHNPSTEPSGQEVYVSRPTVAEVEAVLASSTVGAGAVLNGGDISGAFPLTIDASNDDLKVRLSAAPTAFTTVLIPQAAYASLALLVAAVNSVLQPHGILARVNVAGNGVALESKTRGVASYIENDTIANGSVANTPLSLANGAARTMPAASAFITATLPVGGPLDVSTTAINGVGATTNSNALSLIPTSRGTQAALANAIAPKIADTPTAQDSFLKGQLRQLRNAAYNPDPNRLSAGAAVSVVQNDGSSGFAFTSPVISSATLDSPVTGAVTIAGTFLSGPGAPTAERKEVVVKFLGKGAPNNNDPLVLSQELIERNGGTVTATAIVIPAALNTKGFAAVTTTVQVKHRSHISNVQALA